jgi:hypothetical protein
MIQSIKKSRVISPSIYHLCKCRINMSQIDLFYLSSLDYKQNLASVLISVLLHTLIARSGIIIPNVSI